MTGVTDTFGPDSPRAHKGELEWALCVALDCERLAVPPLRLGLRGMVEVEVGRGDERTWARDGKRLLIELPDRRASQAHLQLRATAEGWLVEDRGSKNGTWVNQRRVERASLGDGDVIECGGTFLVMRRAVGPIRDLERPAGPSESLATLSPSLERELSILPKIARSRSPILVRGDSGTGKEVAAGVIHALSGRSGPMVAINCGAIPATLVESELFGSRRGAFSGAADRPGLVRSAENGTLFLDEVAELPMASQVALLRVLQEGEVLPLGAGKPLIVDVRVLAATHQPFEELVEAGRFRRDLYARLCGYELRLPALSARIEDLGMLTAALIARIRPEGPTPKISRAAARALFGHPWRLHVRELEQTLRAALAIASGGELGLNDLRLRSDADPPPPPDNDERRRLVAALEQHRGNLSAVARALVTSRSQVQRLMERHGLRAGDFRRR